jgi:hypothetical protein
MVANKKLGVALIRSADKLLSADRVGRERFFDEGS